MKKLSNTEVELNKSVAYKKGVTQHILVTFTEETLNGKLHFLCNMNLFFSLVDFSFFFSFCNILILQFVQK